MSFKLCALLGPLQRHRIPHQNKAQHFTLNLLSSQGKHSWSALEVCELGVVKTHPLCPTSTWWGYLHNFCHRRPMKKEKQGRICSSRVILNGYLSDSLSGITHNGKSSAPWTLLRQSSAAFLLVYQPVCTFSGGLCHLCHRQMKPALHLIRFHSGTQKILCRNAV